MGSRVAPCARLSYNEFTTPKKIITTTTTTTTSSSSLSSSSSSTTTTTTTGTTLARLGARGGGRPRRNATCVTIAYWRGGWSYGRACLPLWRRGVCDYNNNITLTTTHLQQHMDNHMMTTTLWQQHTDINTLTTTHWHQHTNNNTNNNKMMMCIVFSLF